MIIICGCAIALLSFGPRSSLGFFIQPMSREFSWGRDVFGLALALQNLLWGLGQPIAGAIADRFGVLRVMCVGALLYAGGLLMMRYAATPLSLDLGAGVLIGFGLSGCSFNLVLSAFSKLLPPEKRGIALGAGTAAGSFGQFLFAPFGVAMIDNFGWQAALMVFAVLMLLIVPLSLALATPPAMSANVPAARSAVVQDGAGGSVRPSLLCAAGARLLHLRLSTGLHHRASAGLSVRSRHLGADRRLGDCRDRPVQHHRFAQRRLAAEQVSQALHPVDRSISSGRCRSSPSSRSRSRTFSAIVFGAVTGLTWLSTVPPTSALVALMFGTRWFATLYGFAFVSHQVGGFLGVWLGGIVFEQFGSYTPIWWLSVLFGVLSALINLPIVEAPVARPVAQPA